MDLVIKRKTDWGSETAPVYVLYAEDKEAAEKIRRVAGTNQPQLPLVSAERYAEMAGTTYRDHVSYPGEFGNYTDDLSRYRRFPRGSRVSSDFFTNKNPRITGDYGLEIPFDMLLNTYRNEELMRDPLICVAINRDTLGSLSALDVAHFLSAHNIHMRL